VKFPVLTVSTDKDMVTMFEEAYKQQPNNEDLAAQTFFANVRILNWKAAQQVTPPFLLAGHHATIF
jgi:hypothetical protein